MNKKKRNHNAGSVKSDNPVKVKKRDLSKYILRIADNVTKEKNNVMVGAKKKLLGRQKKNFGITKLKRIS